MNGTKSKRYSETAESSEIDSKRRKMSANNDAGDTSTHTDNASDSLSETSNKTTADPRLPKAPKMVDVEQTTADVQQNGSDAEDVAQLLRYMGEIKRATIKVTEESARLATIDAELRRLESNRTSHSVEKLIAELNSKRVEVNMAILQAQSDANEARYNAQTRILGVATPRQSMCKRDFYVTFRLESITHNVSTSLFHIPRVYSHCWLSSPATATMVA